MIVREYLQNPDMSFDYFNDAEDTINWLRQCQHIELANKLEHRWKVWLKTKGITVPKES